MSRFERRMAVVLAGLVVLLSGADRRAKISSALKDAEAKFEAAASLRHDDIEARRAFRAATVAYYRVMQLGGETPALRLMQGNSSVLAGNAHFAIYCYRCGLAGDPYDRDLRRGLEYARTLVAYSSPEERQALTPKDNLFERIKRPVHRRGAEFVAILGVLGWLTLGRWIVTRKPWLLALAACALLATGAVVAVWLVDHSQDIPGQDVRHAVVEKSGVLRTGDGPSFSPAREAPLPRGVEVRMLRGGQWVQVELADGSVGWLPGECVVPLTDGRPLIEMR
jgi:hypothetical protein